MPERPSDRNLLFGIVALQMDFIKRDTLIRAMQEWILNKQEPLGEILVQARALEIADRQLLDQMVDRHIEMHDGDLEKSLAALSSIGPVRDTINKLEDPDLQASITFVPGRLLSATEIDLPKQTFPSDNSLGESAVNSRFRVIRPHAEGGLGKVSVAVDGELNREVALKEIKDKYVNDRSARSRFTLEAEITGGLEHPGIVPVYGLGHRSDGRPFYAMRFIKGASLKDACAQFHRERLNRPASETALEFRKLLRRFIDVCYAIEYAHSRGILHRDLKPGNIMLGKYGETLVVDWGLAKAVGREEVYKQLDEQTLLPRSAESNPATQIGSTLGTPHYMSPEQAAGKLHELGPATDVYSLGATLFYLLVNRAPFIDRDVSVVLQKVQNGEFQSPVAIDNTVPKELGAICLKAMAVDPSNRYSSPKSLSDDLERWLADEPVSVYSEPWTRRAARWAKRHRTTAVSALVSLTVAVIALAAGLILLDRAGRREASLRVKAEEALRDAEIARDQVQHRSAQMETANAIREMEAGNHGNALHWLHRSLLHENVGEIAEINRFRIASLVNSSPRLKRSFKPVAGVDVADSTWKVKHDNQTSTFQIFDRTTGATISPSLQHTTNDSDKTASVSCSASSTANYLTSTAGSQAVVWNTKDWSRELVITPAEQAVFLDGNRLLVRRAEKLEVWDIALKQSVQEIPAGDAGDFLDVRLSRPHEVLITEHGTFGGAQTFKFRSLKDFNTISTLSFESRTILYDVSPTAPQVLFSKPGGRLSIFDFTSNQWVIDSQDPVVLPKTEACRE